MKKIYALSLLALFLTVRSHAQCQAAFTYSNVNNVYSFTDASTTSSGSVIAWLWTFGDLSAPSTQQNPQHTYTNCGYYVVTLNITTSSFCTSSFTDTILVSSGFSAGYSFTTDTVTGTVNFNAQPLSASLNYNWDFGDNSTGTGVAPSHTYATSGNYNVCLVVGDTGGICTDTVCSMVNVYIAPPSCNAAFTSNIVGGPGNETFTATPFNLNWTYVWNFGDSNIGLGFVTTHQYTSSGTYTVCLTVSDTTNGCSSQFCDTVDINLPSSCPPAFTANGLNGIYVFTASPLNIQNTYSWDFGDGSPAGTGAVANHTYFVSGTYTVCVTMTTPYGCTGTACDTINVTISGVEEHPGVLPLTFFPNPATEKLVINYALPAASDVTIEITDPAGRLLSSGQQHHDAGKYQDEINVASLAPGTYMLRIKTMYGNANRVFIRE